MDQQEQKMPQGWKDVVLTLDMPIGAALSFINALNQRIAAIEDVTKVPYESKMITLTELYALQAQQAMEQAQAAQEQPAELPDNPEHQPKKDTPAEA